MSLTPAIAPGPYLARVATARPLYVLLFREAISVLPIPADTCRKDQILCGLSLRELARRLDISPSVVGEEMRRLVAHGWVADLRQRRALGFRVGHTLHLVADIAAEQATGDRDLVSRVVLREQAVRGPDRPATGRGLARSFEL